MQVPIKRLEKEFYSLRFPLKLKNKKYSAVLMDGCNFNCYFCFESDKDPDGKPRNKIGKLSIKRIKDFVAKEIDKGNPIEVTGGEPTLFPEATLELLKFIKAKNGYVCLSTNGSRPEVVEQLIPYIDVLGLDIKTSPDKISTYTGTNRQLSYDLPLQTLINSKNYKCDVHFKRIMFKSTALTELEFFYPHASHCYWILKQLRPFPERAKTFLESTSRSIEPLSSENLQKITRQFIQKHPNLKNKLVTICDGSGRDPKNYKYW